MAPWDVVPLSDAAGWRAALEGTPYTMGHTWELCHAVSLTTGIEPMLWVLDVDGMRVVNPFMERPFAGAVDIAKPFGFSGFVGTGPCPDLARWWRTFAEARGYVCGYLGLNPHVEPPGPFPEEEVVTYDTVFTIDLTADVDTMRGRLSSNRRRDLRTYETDAARIVTERDALTAWLVRELPGHMARKGAASHYYFSAETIERIAALPNVFLCGLGPGNAPTTVVLCAATPTITELIFNVSCAEGPDCSTPLYWHAALTAKAAGSPGLNLGGGGHAVGEFKRRFGCITSPLRAVRQVYDRSRYDALCAAAGVTDPATARFFPAYRA